MCLPCTPTFPRWRDWCMCESSGREWSCFTPTHHRHCDPHKSCTNPPGPRDLLVRADVPPTYNSSIPPIQLGMFRCTYRCVTCQEHVLESDFFKSHSTGAHHQIRGHITCSTSNIIYLISCRICGTQYIGVTKNSLKYGSMVTDPQSKPISTAVYSSSIYLIIPFLTWFCRAMRRLVTAGNRSISAEKRCGSGISTPFTPMVSKYRKGMTNLFFLHRYFYICFACQSNRLSCFTPHLTHCSSIISKSLLTAKNSWYLYPFICNLSFVRSQDQYLTLLFVPFFFCVHFTPD